MEGLHVVGACSHGVLVRCIEHPVSQPIELGDKLRHQYRLNVVGVVGDDFEEVMHERVDVRVVDGVLIPGKAVLKSLEKLAQVGREARRALECALRHGALRLLEEGGHIR